jgi:hypothetical protein
MLTMLFQQICDPFALHIFIVMFDHPKKLEIGQRKQTRQQTNKPTNRTHFDILNHLRVSPRLRGHSRFVTAATLDIPGTDSDVFERPKSKNFKLEAFHIHGNEIDE